RDRVLTRIFVEAPVESFVAMRGHDGSAPCVAAVAGLSVYANQSPDARGLVVHNLGSQQRSLAQFCRPSEGDPFALLDELRPELVTVMFTNDVRFRDPDRFARALERLVTRVGHYGVPLIMTAFEQRTPRVVEDAVTAAGTRALTSATARFLPTDV